MYSYQLHHAHVNMIVLLPWQAMTPIQGLLLLGSVLERERDIVGIPFEWGIGGQRIKCRLNG
jgi:hypothetical protein